jgi:tellurite resistance protein TerC
VVEVDLWIWAAFGAFVVAMLAFDLVAFGARGETIPVRRAVAWSIGWTAVGVAFTGVLWAWQGGGRATEYLTGFLIEKSLSVDNLFVFALILGYFAVPAESQRRVIFWGIVGAVVLRGGFILVGATMLDIFHATIYVFGAFLVLTGFRMARKPEVEIHPEKNPALKTLQRFLPVAPRYEGDRLTVRQDGRRHATPLLAGLILIATFDLVFAVDSIPAVFAVTNETFIVFAANAFSLLGLGSLYFVLAGLLTRFRYLPYGLSAVLIFVGAKMVLADVYTIPGYISLLVIVVALTAAVVMSTQRPESLPSQPLASANDDANDRLSAPSRP